MFDEEQLRRHDFEEGREQGVEQTRSESARAVMAKPSLTAEQAMDLLDIPDADRALLLEAP